MITIFRFTQESTISSLLLSVSWSCSTTIGPQTGHLLNFRLTIFTLEKRHLYPLIVLVFKILSPFDILETHWILWFVILFPAVYVLVCSLLSYTHSNQNNLLLLRLLIFIYAAFLNRDEDVEAKESHTPTSVVVSH